MVGTEVYLLYSGTEGGNREDCSIFYVVPEVFLDKAAAKTREKELLEANSGDPEFYTHLAKATVKG